MSVSFSVMSFDELDLIRLSGQRLLRSLSVARKHPGIDEVLVVDDGSMDFQGLSDLLFREAPDVKLYRNLANLGVFLNKIEAVACASGDWVIVCDSDNFKDTEHLDKVLSQPLDPLVWHCPSFARPSFDYRELVGSYNLKSIQSVDEGVEHRRSMARCLLNTGNQMVHRQSFLDVFGQYRRTKYWLNMWRYLDVPECDRSSHYWRQVWDANDSLLFNMLWLYSGGRLSVVPGLEYEHYIGPGDASNYKRSPPEKGTLGNALWKELMTRSKECN